MRLDLREIYLGRVRERERRSSVIDSWSEEVVVEGWVDSGLVDVLARVFEWSVTAVEEEELTESGSGSVAVSVEVVAWEEAMMGRSRLDVLVDF